MNRFKERLEAAVSELRLIQLYAKLHQYEDTKEYLDFLDMINEISVSK